MCDAGLGLDIVAAVSKKPLKWSLRREGSDGSIICFLHAKGLTVQEFSMKTLFQCSDNPERDWSNSEMCSC